MRLEGAWSWEASVRARALSRGLAGPDCWAASGLAPWGRGAMPDMASLRWVTMTEMAWIVLPMPCRHASPSRALGLLADLGDLGDHLWSNVVLRLYSGARGCHARQGAAAWGRGGR